MLLQVPYMLQIAPIVNFALFSILSNPPNILWQVFLEDKFPTHVPVEKSKGKGKGKDGEKRMSKRNVAIKFALDQTISAVANTVMFLAFAAFESASPSKRAKPGALVAAELNAKFWPMLLDGFKIWPFYSVVSFLWIPVDRRVLAGCVVGVGWGVYLNLMSGA